MITSFRDYNKNQQDGNRGDERKKQILWEPDIVLAQVARVS